jgi:hypothetical protein
MCRLGAIPSSVIFVSARIDLLSVLPLFSLPQQNLPSPSKPKAIARRSRSNPFFISGKALYMKLTDVPISA